MIAAFAYAALTFYWGVTWFGAELYENGLCVSGWKFYPWSKVESYEWSEKPKLWHLNFKVGAKKLVVLCDHDQKEEAERILKDVCGDNKDKLSNAG